MRLPRTPLPKIFWDDNLQTIPFKGGSYQAKEGETQREMQTHTNMQEDS